MSTDVERRRALLTAALGFALVDTDGKSSPHEVQTVRKWLDNWKGLGQAVVGMERQGYGLSLTKITDDGWRATFFPFGIAHSIVGGSAWEPTTWRAVGGGRGRR